PGARRPRRERGRRPARLLRLRRLPPRLPPLVRPVADRVPPRPARRPPPSRLQLTRIWHARQLPPAHARGKKAAGIDLPSPAGLPVPARAALSRGPVGRWGARGAAIAGLVRSRWRC